MSTQSRAKRGARVACGGAALVLLFAACGSNPEASGEADVGEADNESVTLRMAWYGDTLRNELTEQALDLFEEEHPDITVEREPLAEAQYYDRLATQMAGGDAPDVIDISASYVSEYSSRGALLDLASYVGETISTEDLNAGLIGGFTASDGEIYAIPFAVNFLTMAYNPEMTGEAGVTLPTDPADWTWDAYRDIALQISEGTDPSVYGAMDEGWYISSFEQFLRQRGGQLYDNCALAFGKQELVDYWTMYDEMRRSGAATSAEVTAGGAAGSLDQFPIATRQAAMQVIFSNSFESLSELTGVDMELIGIPGESPEAGTYLRAADVLAVTSGTEHPEESAMLVDFLVNDPEAGAILGTERGLPVNDEVATAVEGDASPQVAELLRFLRDRQETFGEPPTAPPAGASDLVLEFLDAHQSITFGQSTPEQATDQLFSTAEQALGSC